MNEKGVRQIVIEALQKVTNALDDPELAARLRDPSINTAIADLGIDSLDAIEWCMEIEARSGMELDPVELTTHGSIDKLVSLIVDRSRHAGTASDLPQLVRVSRDGSLPLSLAQESIWGYSQAPQVSAAYALGMSDRILGALDVGVLRDCLSDIVRRHEVLRTTYAVQDGQPVQIIHAAEPIELPVFDVAAEAEPKEAAARIIRTEMARVVDLTQPPLARFSLVRFRDNEHWLLRVCHHILWDDWSTKLILGELALLYNAKIEGTDPPLSESEPLQVADYAAWQRKSLPRGGPAYQEMVAWWKERFQNRPAMPDLPFKRSAPVAGLDPADGVIICPVDPKLVQRLTRLRQHEGTTPYTVWLASLVVLLAAEIGQPEIIVGSYVTNRRREVQNLIGYFTNLATLGFQVDNATPFPDWLSEVRTQVMAAEAVCEIPHEELREELRRLGVILPNVSVIFGAPMGHTRADTNFTGLKVTRPNFLTVAHMPWGFSMNLHEHNNLQEFRTTFDAGIYDPNSVRRFIARLLEFLDVISCHPDRSIGELLALSEQSKRQKSKAVSMGFSAGSL